MAVGVTSAGRHTQLMEIVVILVVLFCSGSGLPYGTYPEERDDQFTFQNFKDFVLAGFSHIHDGSEDCRGDEVSGASASDTIAVAGSDGSPHQVQKGGVVSNSDPEQHQDLPSGDVGQNQKEETAETGLASMEEAGMGEHQNEPVRDLDVPHEEPIEPLGVPHEHDGGEIGDIIRIQDSPQDGIMMGQNDESGVKDAMVKEEI